MGGDLNRVYAGEEICSKGIGALIPEPECSISSARSVHSRIA